MFQLVVGKLYKTKARHHSRCESDAAWCKCLLGKCSIKDVSISLDQLLAIHCKVQSVYRSSRMQCSRQIYLTVKASSCLFTAQPIQHRRMLVPSAACHQLWPLFASHFIQEHSDHRSLEPGFRSPHDLEVSVPIIEPGFAPILFCAYSEDQQIDNHLSAD